MNAGNLIIAAVMCFASHPCWGDVSVSGSLKKWYPVTIDVDEPALATIETANNPNPFLDYRFEIRLKAPSGTRHRVPGFYAGDGLGNGAGSIWRARFSPDETGAWEYTVSFRSGVEVAVDLSDDAGIPIGSDGESGTFVVTDLDPDGAGFLRYGRLEYNGTHYLKFSDGPYWIKGGLDSPENFFGFGGFDNTINQAGGTNSGALVDGVHHYLPHLADWKEGDPDFSNAITGESGKAIIGAVNYLSSEGVNSIYFLPMNLGGDGRETYPFINPDGSRSSNTHYDISKLFQWNTVLQHMQNRSVAAHFVLAENEVSNTEWFDAGELGVERKLYYREMVARFSYLLAVKWNLGEESRFGTARHKQFATYLRQQDWAQHPIAVHSHVDRPADIYDDLLGDTVFDMTSIQFSPVNSDAMVEEWRLKSAQAGWRWVIDMDEVGPGAVGLSNTNIDVLRKQVLYSVYLSGGNLEWYFGYRPLPVGGDIRTEDFRTREAMYRYMRYAREWMIEHLPFWEMQPNDSLHTFGSTTNVQVFEKPGQVYAAYFPDGSIEGEIAVEEGEYTVQWFNPRNGQNMGEERRIAGDRIAVGSPPDTPSEDWAMLIKALGSSPLEPASPEPEGESPDLGAAEGDIDNVGEMPALGEANTKGGVVGIWLLAGMIVVWRRRLAAKAKRSRGISAPGSAP